MAPSMNSSPTPGPSTLLFSLLSSPQSPASRGTPSPSPLSSISTPPTESKSLPQESTPPLHRSIQFQPSFSQITKVTSKLPQKPSQQPRPINHSKQYALLKYQNVSLFGQLSAAGYRLPEIFPSFDENEANKDLKLKRENLSPIEIVYNIRTGSFRKTLQLHLHPEMTENPQGRTVAGTAVRDSNNERFIEISWHLPPLLVDGRRMVVSIPKWKHKMDFCWRMWDGDDFHTIQRRLKLPVNIWFARNISGKWKEMYIEME